MKKIKGFVYIGFLEKGWTGQDSAVFVYRKSDKKSGIFIPVLVTPLTPSKRKK
jgi:hypothetical protein